MLKCPKCGATASKNGKPFYKQNALDLHLRLHCTGEAGDRMKPSPPDVECDHEWTLLNPHNEFHAKAIRAGFRLVCKKEGCSEVK